MADDDDEADYLTVSPPPMPRRRSLTLESHSKPSIGKTPECYLVGGGGAGGGGGVEHRMVSVIWRGWGGGRGGLERTKYLDGLTSALVLCKGDRHVT